MKQKNTIRIVSAALFAAIVCIATFVVKIPTPQGFYNLGDCFVILCGWYLGPVYGTLAAGIGSALADVISGYAQYAPATFVIKALMAVAAYFILKALKSKKFLSKFTSGIAAEAIMILGYFAYESVILSYGFAAASNVLFNAVQGVVGLAAAIAVSAVIDRSKTLSSFFKR